MPDALATHVLLEKAQHGDGEALNELCRRYQPRVLAAVRIRLGADLRQRVESWDIVQEVMIDAEWRRGPLVLQEELGVGMRTPPSVHFGL